MDLKTKWNRDFLEGIRRPNTNRVVLLYSGGIDSTASAILLRKQGYTVYPLFISYGQASLEAEISLARIGTVRMGLQPLKVMDVTSISQICSSELIESGAMEDDAAWLPARNTLFMILAGMYAQTIDADAISIGYGIADNFVFGDNMLVHHQLVEVLLSCSLSRELKVYTPIKQFDKAQLIEIVRHHGMLDFTMSCWNAKWQDDKIIVCTECANCLEREAALKGVK